MNRPLFALIVAAVVIVAFLAMWFGWRARSKRDAVVHGAMAAPVGALIAEFERVLYVSTTPVGEPLSRVAAPGLRYRGQAELSVRADGVAVQVVGENPVFLAASDLRGGGTAGRRVGKAVEHDGLALMRWDSEGRHLESSFRFDTREEQQRFLAALEQISHSQAEATADLTSTSQEDTE